jgi:hypothetical protein
MKRLDEAAPARSSGRARRCLAAIVGGYFVLAVIAGAPHSPLTTPLPVGARPPGWSTFLAEQLGLRRLGRPVLTAISLLLVGAVLVAFVLLLTEARSNKVRLSSVLMAAGVSLVLAVAAPVLLSRDLFSYAAYGRIYALHYHNPYVSVPASFPGDPFVLLTAAQWKHVHSLYGPVFTLISALIVRTTSRSPDATILAFKMLAGSAVGVAAVLASKAGTRIGPNRAALAAAAVGLNPVLVIHTVGGAHVDALMAAPLAGALVWAVTIQRSKRSSLLGSMGVTTLLTVACLIKVVIVPALVLWLWWIASRDPGAARPRTLAIHLAVVVGVTVALLWPFFAGWHTFAPLTTLGGVESWASPAQFVARGTQELVGSLGDSGAGTVAGKAVVAGFLLLFVWLFWRLASRMRTWGSLADGWGSALLLLALASPYLLPWFAAWFAPFLGLMTDEAMLWIGVGVSELLALTIIPADPPQGLSAWGVMGTVHYVIAPLMLALFALAAVRMLRDGAGRNGLQARLIAPRGRLIRHRAAHGGPPGAGAIRPPA